MDRNPFQIDQNPSKMDQNPSKAMKSIKNDDMF